MRPEDILIQCDFDGTITMEDVMVGLNKRFSDVSWSDLIAQWERKEITTREALVKMYGMIRASREDVHRFIHEDVVVRPGFASFLDWCRSKGIDFVIVSEGLDHVIEETLAMIGVEAKVITNHAIFGPEYLAVEFPETPPLCKHDDGDICGTCKVHHVQEAKGLGKYVIYIGDGTTDVRPALEADMVFARRALLKGMDALGRNFTEFKDFDDVRAGIEPLLDG
jgi:2-hydroxy-3-keto-5-methylthiopentenyl-1-phosphate phosphatase